MTITGNTISGDHYGVWLGVNDNVEASIAHNSYSHVTIHVFTFS